VGPATDYAVGSGTTIVAPFSGTVDHWWSDTGGWTVRVTAPGGFPRFIAQHNSTFRGPSSGSVSEGTAIALSGNTGSASKGAHSHEWIENPDRIAMEEYMAQVGLGYVPYTDPWSRTPGTSTAGGGLTPITPKSGVDMLIWYYPFNGTYIALDPARGEYRDLSQQEVLHVLDMAKAGLIIIREVPEPGWTESLGGLRGVSRWMPQPLAAAPDPKPIIEAIKAALDEHSDGPIDEDLIVASVRQAMAEEFARVNANINDSPADALATKLLK